MRRTDEREIDGEMYEIIQFSATKSLQLTYRLGRIIGEPFSKLFAGGMDKDLSDDAIGMAVRSFFENCDEATFVKTIKELLECVMVDGKEVSRIFETHFAGRMGTLFKVVVAVLEVQFKSFFQEMLGAKSRATLRSTSMTSTLTQ